MTKSLDELYDTLSQELSDSDYLTLCIAHGVEWTPGPIRPYAFIKPRWLSPCLAPARHDCRGWVAKRATQ